MSTQQCNTEEHVPTHIALDDGWGPTPPTVHQFLKEKECFNKHNKMIVMDLLSMVSLREKEKIHDIKVYSGWTCVISVHALAERNDMSERSVYYAIKELEDKKAIERRKVGKCYKFRVMIYPKALKRLEQNPDHPKHQITTSVPNPARVAEIEKEAAFIPAPVAVENPTNPAPVADKQELKDLREDPGPHPGPRVQAQEATGVPNKEGEGEKLEISENQEDPPATQPAAALPTGVPADDRLEEKNSQKEKDVEFFRSSSFSLADKFAGDDLEYTPPDLHRKHAAQFRDQLMKMFRSPALVDRYPDEGVRLARCTESLRIWIEIVQDRDKPAFSVGFLSTEVGMRALIQAKKQAMEGFADYQEIELDPAIVELSRAKWGANWKEKRKQENERRRGHGE